MKKTLTLAVIVTLLTGCTLQPTAAPTQPVIIITSTSTSSPVAEQVDGTAMPMEIIPAILQETLQVTFPSPPTRRPTSTPISPPTFTPYSSRTPFPSLTPRGTGVAGMETPGTQEGTRSPTRPGETTTPLPPGGQPVTFSGVGGVQVVTMDRSDGPSVAMLRHDGAERFEVVLSSANMASLGALISTDGPYLGVRPLNFDRPYARTMTIRASGAWQIDILPLADAHSVVVPDTIEGVGDDVVLLQGGEPAQVIVTAGGDSGYFVVESFLMDPLRSLGQLIVASAPYSGTVQMDPTTGLLVIEASGPWEIQVTSP